MSWALAALAGLALAAFLIIEQPWAPAGPKPVAGGGKVETPPDRSGPVAKFTLTGADGKTVTERDFRGKWLIVYFGFTYCPDVCPTGLAKLSQILERLGPRADKIRPIFISVDPERDTPQKVGKYVRAFDKRFIGLVGSMAQTRAAAKAFGAYFKKRSTGKSKDAYLVDHSSFYHVMGPDGRFRAVYGSTERIDTIAKSIEALMRKEETTQ
jgi:protein SCO1/2